jgi:hypothetical protein
MTTSPAVARDERPERIGLPAAPTRSRPPGQPGEAAPPGDNPSSASGRDESLRARAALGYIEGRVVEESGAGVAGAEVRAESAERSGKESRYVAAAKTDAGGDFRVAVPAVVADGQIYSLIASHENFVRRRSDRVAVRPGHVATLDPLTVIRSASDVAGDYGLDVLVIDDAGGPVAGAAVGIHRRVKTVADSGLATEWEAGGVTDAEGRVRLEGKRLGEKWLRVDARRNGLRLHEESVPVGEPGDHALEVALVPGLAIAGHVRAGEDSVPDGVTLVAIAEDDGRGDDWIHADVSLEDNGAFRFAGLGSGRYQVIASAEGFSPFRVEAVAAGTEGLDIRLKRADDDSDTGDHLAEIHGTVRDARTGKLVSVGWDAVEVERLPDEMSDEDLRRDVFPTLLASMSRQVMFTGGGPPPPSAEFHATGLDAGAYALVARVNGYAAAISGPFRLAAREIVKDVELKLDRGVAVGGTVAGPDGAPVKDAFVFLVGDGERSRARIAEFDEAVRESAGRGTVMIWGEVKTDEGGRFQFNHVPADLAVRVAAVHPKLAPDVALAAADRVTLRLAAR